MWLCMLCATSVLPCKQCTASSMRTLLGRTTRIKDRSCIMNLELLLLFSKSQTTAPCYFTLHLSTPTWLVHEHSAGYGIGSSHHTGLPQGAGGKTSGHHCKGWLHSHGTIPRVLSQPVLSFVQGNAYTCALSLECKSVATWETDGKV